jgi:hypothetical protein
MMTGELVPARDIPSAVDKAGKRAHKGFDGALWLGIKMLIGTKSRHSTCDTWDMSHGVAHSRSVPS